MSYAEHQNLIKRFNLKLPKRIPKARFFSRSVGKFLSMRYMKDLVTGACQIKDWNKYIVVVNKKGMADGYILVKMPEGLFNNEFQLHIEIEAKTGKARQTPEQITWKKFIESTGGKYILMRDEDTAITEIEQYIDGLFTD